MSPTTKVLAIPCDITNENSVTALFSKAKSKVTTLDVLICNAGGAKTLHAYPKIGQAVAGDWWADWELNLKGTYLCIHHYLSILSPSTPTGTIISISSGAAFALMPGQSAYSLAKRAIAGLIEYVTKEYPSMRAFSMTPGIIATRDTPKEFLPFAKDTVELVGGTTLYLCTERAAFLSGRWFGVNWDVEEMEGRKEEILGKGLLGLRFLEGEEELWDGGAMLR